MSATRRPAGPALDFEIHRYKLANGLRVVLAPDRSSPAVAVACYYDVGFRSEPEGRTGFAHLFEHLMFQGSATLEKLEHFRLVTGNGGVFNGSTRNDFTNYYELLPSNALELGLFLEADRMRSIRLTQENLENQVAVVKEEVHVNVLNQPYGGFPWIDLPAALFTTFPNAHNAYGEFADLDAATLEDAADFFETYYSPANAVLTVAGDFEVAGARRLIKKHYASIEARPAPLPVDASEPRLTRENWVIREDEKAPEPALAIGYRVPDPISESRDYLAAVLATALLTRGDASRLHQRLVKTDRVATDVSGAIGLVADTFEVRGPSMFQITAMFTSDTKADAIAGTINEELRHLAENLPDQSELDAFRRSMISQYLGSVDSLLNRVMLLAAFEQQRSTPKLINSLPADLAKVEPADISRVVAKWLTPESRAVVEVVPSGEQPGGPKARRKR